jgi:hypothetical protein
MYYYNFYGNHIGLPASKKVSKEEIKDKTPRWIPVPLEERSPPFKTPCQVFHTAVLANVDSAKFNIPILRFSFKNGVNRLPI